MEFIFSVVCAFGSELQRQRAGGERPPDTLRDERGARGRLLGRGPSLGKPSLERMTQAVNGP